MTSPSDLVLSQVNHLILQEYSLKQDVSFAILEKQEHFQYLKKYLLNIGKFSQGLDTGQPWIMFWCLNGMQLLQEGDIVTAGEKKALVKLLQQMQSKEGVFGGGAYQMGHLASCYAATMAACILGEPGYQVVNKQKTYDWLLAMKNPEGSFKMHHGGESDMRAIYTAMVVASVLDLLTPELTSSVAEYIVSCQTYEGGLGSGRFSEAHGGYTCCGVAALAILGRLHTLDLDSLLSWLTNRQVEAEGGFSGRTNKLVDACYSFWQGAIFAILKDHSPRFTLDGSQLYDQQALQKYLLLCCQAEDGGLKDKPGKMADLYHTCYSLAGMSLSQLSSPPALYLSKSENQLPPLDPVYNIPVEQVRRAQAFFRAT